MPIADDNCPHCGGPVHTDGLIGGLHELGCKKEFSDEWLEARGWL